MFQDKFCDLRALPWWQFFEFFDNFVCAHRINYAQGTMLGKPPFTGTSPRDIAPAPQFLCAGSLLCSSLRHLLGSGRGAEVLRVRPRLESCGDFLVVLDSVGQITRVLLFGPHLLRQDLRRDLQQMDVLKLYPMPGWQLVLGELLAPAVILSAIQWCLLVVAIGFFPQMQSNASWGLIAGCGFGAAIVLPLLDLILLLIPNAAVLIFPAWFQVSADARGIEATGQRLVFMLGQLMVFALALIPAFLAFAIVFFPIKMAVALAPAVPLGALAAVLFLPLLVLRLRVARAYRNEQRPLRWLLFSLSQFEPDMHCMP